MRLCIYVVPVFFKYGYDMVSSFEGCSGVVLVLDHPLSLISGPVVASVHNHPSSPIVGPVVVLVLDCPSSRFVGPDSSRFPAVLVMPLPKGVQREREGRERKRDDKRERGR